MYNTKYRANLNISLLKLIVTFINHVTASDFYEKCLFPENRTISLFYSQHKSYSEKCYDWKLLELYFGGQNYKNNNNKTGAYN